MTTKADDSFVTIDIADNGVGISQENMVKIFSHGFTNRKDGHGLGLHFSLLAAREMRGELTFLSAGVGKGAVFSLKIPLVKEGEEDIFKG